MRLFALDLHISVIADLKEILKDHEVVEWSLSGHNWVFGRAPSKPEVIDQSSWKGLTLEQIRRFQERYDDFLKGFDGFLVGYVPAYAMLYEKYGKPILGSVCCRYDVPFCFTKDRATREHWHTALRRMTASGQLRLAANNRGDADYFTLGTGLTIPLRPSLCRYTGMVHNPVRSTFFWYSHHHTPSHPLITPRVSGFKWSDLAEYRGVIHIPYEISTMSLCEQYQAGIPIFVPTKRFLRELWSQGRAEWWSVNSYWGSQMPSEMAVARDVDFWIHRADFYDTENMPYVYTFDSIDDLLGRLANFEDVDRHARLGWIRSRETRVVHGWREALENGPSGPVVEPVLHDTPVGGA